MAQGWRDEGVAFHSDNAHAVPVWRLYNPLSPSVAAHHVTIDRNEREQLVASHGWRFEGVAWYSAAT